MATEKVFLIKIKVDGVDGFLPCNDSDIRVTSDLAEAKLFYSASKAEREIEVINENAKRWGQTGLTVIGIVSATHDYNAPRATRVVLA